jgi:hypothetical protein
MQTGDGELKQTRRQQNVLSQLGARQQALAPRPAAAHLQERVTA